MRKKRIIRKVLTLLFWLMAGVGMVTLLVAANRRERGHEVRDVLIHIAGDGQQFFIDKADILQLVTRAHRRRLVGSPLETLQLARLEETLERGVWIREAELFIDSRDVLHVQVAEREPVARVFTTTGRSFYIDSAGKQLPLLEKESARVLVVTNYPDVLLGKSDSLCAEEVRQMARSLHADPFWKEQLAHIDLLPGRQYEAFPVVGNHVIRLGDFTDFESKLRRLMIFYRQVLSKTGFDRYTAIDLRFSGQVVGVQGSLVSPIDSVQLQKNIEQLLLRARQHMVQDSLATVVQQVEDSTRMNRPARVSDSAGLLPLTSVQPDTAIRRQAAVMAAAAVRRVPPPSPAANNRRQQPTMQQRAPRTQSGSAPPRNNNRPAAPANDNEY